MVEQMPIVPLYDGRGEANGWHQVMSPGGYEGWFFDCEDAKGDVRVSMGIMEGGSCAAEYLRRYREYRRRPTRRAPPTAREYPCARTVVWRAGKIAEEYFEAFGKGALVAATDEMKVKLGGNVMRREGPGFRVEMAEIALDFVPRWSSAAWEGVGMSRALAGAEHRWVISGAMCDVRGTVNGAAFAGRGFHDHWYGTGPMELGLRRWMRGRVLLEDRTVAFVVAEGRDGVEEGKMVVIDAAGAREVNGNWMMIGEGGLPREVKGERIELTERIEMGRGRQSAWGRYAARVEGEMGVAFCEGIDGRGL